MNESYPDKFRYIFYKNMFDYRQDAKEERYVIYGLKPCNINLGIGISVDTHFKNAPMMTIFD